jgi:4-carboxymuconolactone decarboxylase
MPDDAEFGSFGRYAEVAVAQMPADMREAYEFTRSLRGLVPGPHRIWVANPALSRTIVPTGAYFQTRSTLTKAEIEIVTLLVTAHWRSAYACHEHEEIAVAQGHLDPASVRRLIAGLGAEFDDPREAVVHALASALVRSRIVAGGLFREAEARLGVAGIIDVAVLIGWFTMVSMTLAAFGVPANADRTALPQ